MMYDPNQARATTGEWTKQYRSDPETGIVSSRIDLSPAVEKVLDHLRRRGMRPILVGGSVRDALIDPDISPKDLDFEVYGGSPKDIESALRSIGRPNMVGASFGVVKFNAEDGTELDLSVPRRDNRVGVGHRGFEVEFDDTMEFDEASSRRDFTINAIGYDPASGEYIDPHGGIGDIEDRVLRHVSPAFSEDPLRVLRGVQFAARFDATMAPETVDMCRHLVNDAVTLPDERVRSEWEKFCKKGVNLSQGWAILEETGWNKTLPGAPRNISGLDDIDVDLAPDRSVAVTALVMSQIPEEHREAFARRTLEGAQRQRIALDVARTGSNLPTTLAGARLAANDSVAPLRYKLAVASASGHDISVPLAVVRDAGVMDSPEPVIVQGLQPLSPKLTWG